MPFFARLVIATAMLTSGWLNCFGQVHIRPEIVADLQAMEIEVLIPKTPETPETPETSETSKPPEAPVPQNSDSTSGTVETTQTSPTEIKGLGKPVDLRPTTRGVHRIVWLIHDLWPTLGGWGTLIAWSAAVLQLLAGVLLLVGLFTRWAALIVCIAVGMAIYIVSVNIHGMFSMNPFNWPLDSHRFIQLFAGLGLFTLSLWLLFGGAGSLSIDYLHAKPQNGKSATKRKTTKKSDE